MRTTNPVAAALIGTAMIVAAEWGFMEWVDGDVQPKWSITQGIIRSAKVARGKHGTIQAIYDYQVDGRDFVGRRVAPTAFPDTQIVDELDTARPGDPIKVYYDPGRPSSAVLSTGSHAWLPAPWLRRCIWGCVLALAWLPVAMRRPH